MDTIEPTGRPEPTASQRAASLKERVYISFTSLAVVLALRSHADETTPAAAAATLTIVVVGSLLGIFVADLLSHLTVHAKLPSGPELHHMVAVSTGVPQRPGDSAPAPHRGRPGSLVDGRGPVNGPSSSSLSPSSSSATSPSAGWICRSATRP